MLGLVANRDGRPGEYDVKPLQTLTHRFARSSINQNIIFRIGSILGHGSHDSALDTHTHTLTGMVLYDSIPNRNNGMVLVPEKSLDRGHLGLWFSAPVLE